MRDEGHLLPRAGREDRASRPATSTTWCTATGRCPPTRVIQSIAKAVGVKADSFREFRIRKVSETLAKKPDLVDKVYVDIVKGK